MLLFASVCKQLAYGLSYMTALAIGGLQISAFLAHQPLTPPSTTLPFIPLLLAPPVSRCGLAVRRLAGEQKDLGSVRFGSPFSSLQKLWFMDTVL